VTDKVKTEVIHSGVGSVTESDATLASASNAVVLGFHSKIDTGVGDVAKREGVEIKLYAIIYELIDEVKEAMAGLLDPTLKDVVTGQAEVRKIFELSKGGNVAGCAVTSGKIVRGKMRVIRKGDLVYEGISHTLKRFKDEVNEVSSGMECGIRLDGFDDFKEGDIVECYMQEKVAQKL
jgi:translation initiation factor IF-2